MRTFNTRFAPARTYSTAPHAEDASAQKPDAPAAEKAPEPPAEKPKRPWYRHPAFIVLILALLMGPSAVKLVREKLLQAALDSPVLAMFPPSVRKPVLNALALEQAGNPLQAAQWYYVALTKAIEENVDPQSEIITALIIRWAGLEAETGNPTKAMELYENLFWKLIKEPPSVESDGTTWKVEPAEARASRLDRAALMALYAAGAVEFAGHAQTERELYEQALMWNRRAVNAFLSKNGSAAAIGPETIDNDLEWIVDMAPDVADLAKLEYVPIFEEDLKRHAAELAAAKGIEAPPDVKEAAAKPAIFETLPKSPLKPYLRQSNNLTVLITAFNNISEYSFVLDTALRNPPVPKTKGDFYEVDPQTLLRALSYRLHGALLDLNEVHDPCGLSVQLAGIMETYANTGSIGAGSAEEFGKKARELAVFALEKKVANPISCVECVMSVSSILGGMFKVRT